MNVAHGRDVDVAGVVTDEAEADLLSGRHRMTVIKLVAIDGFHDGLIGPLEAAKDPTRSRTPIVGRLGRATGQVLAFEFERVFPRPSRGHVFDLSIAVVDAVTVGVDGNKNRFRITLGDWRRVGI